MSTPRKIVVIGGVALLLTLLFLWLRSEPPSKPDGIDALTAKPATKATPTQLPTNDGKQPPPPAANPMQALLQTPITFYGIVLDQNQNPVPGATVSATVLNQLPSGTPVSTSSGADGRFTIRTNGASLHVRVSKNGYDDIDRGGQLKPTSQGFDFAADTGRGIHQSDPSSPAVFHLRKPGKPVALERLNGQAKVPRDGVAVPLSLSRKGSPVLAVKCVSEAHTDDSTAPFDWRCEVVVDGGGIQEATDATAFEAPAQGYAASAVIDMPKSLGPQKWRDAETKNYWVQLPDKSFAKVRFRMMAGGDHFAVVDGFRNPSPNDRNLEPKLESP